MIFSTAPLLWTRTILPLFHPVGRTPSNLIMLKRIVRRTKKGAPAFLTASFGIESQPTAFPAFSVLAAFSTSEGSNSFSQKPLGSEFNEHEWSKDKTRQDKTRQDQTRQDKTRQDKGYIVKIPGDLVLWPSTAMRLYLCSEACIHVTVEQCD